MALRQLCLLRVAGGPLPLQLCLYPWKKLAGGGGGILFPSTSLGPTSSPMRQKHSSCEKRGIENKVMAAQNNRGLCSSAGNSIIYRMALPTQREAILDLLYHSFFADEPMTTALGLYDGKNRVDALTKYAEACLEENLSIVAMDGETGELLGISINGATHKRDALLAPLEAKLKGLDPKHPFRHIISLMHEANVKAGEEIYSELDSDVLFDVKIVTTNRHNRKGGLGTDLLRRSFKLAQILDFKGCKTEATGAFSRRAFEKNGFVARSEVSYEEFEDDSGNKPFQGKDMGPHKCTTLLTKDLTKNDD